MGKTPGKKIGQLAARKPPKHLTVDQKAICAEITLVLEDSTWPQVVEIIAITIGIIREARSILARDSVVIVTAKGEKAAHPALNGIAESVGILPRMRLKIRFYIYKFLNG